MKSLGTVFIAGLALSACDTGGKASLATFADSASYAVGQRMAASVKQQGAEVDLSTMVAGLRDGMADDTAGFSHELINDLLGRLANEGRQQRESTMQAEAADNIAAGDAFRAEFATREGVQQTDTGILYQIITEGDGPKPGPTDRVEVHYHGTLVDGTVFDSSRDRGETITFGLNQVIPGWTQALQLMSVGSKYLIVIPPEWAYGTRGSPPRIGPESTLMFGVGLFGIE
jgi:FKBP-type peptidyl-prolyl cis-trans isomerase